MAGSRFAKGRHALSISDRSGAAFPYIEMVREWTGAWVHTSEFEIKQPQIQPRPVGSDPQALQFARPSRTAPVPADLLRYNPLTTYAAGSGLVNVNLPGHGYSAGDTKRFRGTPTTAGAFNDSEDIDGITGATVCRSAGYTISLGQYTSTTTTLVQTITASSTVDILLTSATGFRQFDEINYLLIGTEFISYTGIDLSDNNLEGVKRGVAGTTAAGYAGGTTMRSMGSIKNNFYFTAATNATTGGIEGGGYPVSVGPVTIEA